MDWVRYKQLCDQPDYWSRWMLEQCIELFTVLREEQLVAQLHLALAGDPLPVPPDHKGPAGTQMYNLCLSPEQRTAGVEAIETAAVRGIVTRQTQARGLGGFVEAWREYSVYTEGAEGAEKDEKAE